MSVTRCELHSGPLSALRGATPPSRNNLSHANKHRDAALAERLFWAVLEHLQKLSPAFATGRRGKGLARRFRRVIHVVDSSIMRWNIIVECVGEYGKQSTITLGTTSGQARQPWPPKNPRGMIFSNSTNTLSAAMQARFITPTANRTAIKSQQQPRQ
jgi:hypothetical protein